MNVITLKHGTGNRAVDEELRGLIGIFERVFPDRVRAYYLVGSFVTGDTIGTSDLDLRVIFKDRVAPGEAERMERVRDECRMMSSWQLDLPLLSEAHFQAGDVDPLALLHASLFLYGQDIRGSLVLPSMMNYTRLVTSAPYRNLLIRLRRREVAPYPLDYPDPTGEFLGYDLGSTTQQFVVGIGWAATAMIVIKARRYVAKKSDWLRLYGECINDEWVPFLTTVYQTCRGTWAYGLPAEPAQRLELRELCRQALGFENHYLRVYRDYLVAELASQEQERQLFALGRLSQVLYRDDDVRTLLEQRATSSNAAMRQRAAHVLTSIAKLGRCVNVQDTWP